MYVGIDIGAKGCMAILDDNSNLTTQSFNKGGLEVYRDLLLEIKPKRILIERVHSLPHQGVKSMFSFGQRYGEVLGMLVALRLDFDTLLPQQWQKIFFHCYLNNVSIEEPSKNTKNTKLLVGEAVNEIFHNKFRNSKHSPKTDITDAIALALVAKTL